MSVCQRDRVGGASGKGRHRDVCVCQRDRLGGASGKGIHRDVCVCVHHVRGET